MLEHGRFDLHDENQDDIGLEQHIIRLFNLSSGVVNVRIARHSQLIANATNLDPHGSNINDVKFKLYIGQMKHFCE
ncbi:MAG TPA: hypothetical protein VH415_02630 [Nitrososphaeraceae archaeon]